MRYEPLCVLADRRRRLPRAALGGALEATSMIAINIVDLVLWSLIIGLAALAIVLYIFRPRD
jgi:hypothetical protein